MNMFTWFVVAGLYFLVALGVLELAERMRLIAEPVNRRIGIFLSAIWPLSLFVAFVVGGWNRLFDKWLIPLLEFLKRELPYAKECLLRTIYRD